MPNAKVALLDRPITSAAAEALHAGDEPQLESLLNEVVARTADEALLAEIVATEDSVCFDTLAEADLEHGHWHQEFGHPSGIYVSCSKPHDEFAHLIGGRIDVVKLLHYFSEPSRRASLVRASNHDCFAAVICKLIADYRASRPVSFNAQVSEKEASVVAFHPQTGRIAYCFDRTDREMPALYRDQGYQRVNFKSFRKLERFCRGQGTVNDIETDHPDGLECDYVNEKRAHHEHVTNSVRTVRAMREEFERRKDYHDLQRDLKRQSRDMFDRFTSRDGGEYER